MSINQTDIKRFHANGLVTLSPRFPRALLNAANEAIDAIDDADFFSNGNRIQSKRHYIPTVCSVSRTKPKTSTRTEKSSAS